MKMKELGPTRKASDPTTPAPPGGLQTSGEENSTFSSDGSRISQRGASTPKVGALTYFWQFPSRKRKELDRGHASLVPPFIHQYSTKIKMKIHEGMALYSVGSA